MRVCLATFISAALVSGAAIAEDSKPEIKAGHNLLAERESSVLIAPGESVPSFAFRDTAGKPHYLEDAVENGPAVFVFMSTRCPLAKRYTTRLTRVFEKYSQHHVSVFAVFPNEDETVEGIAAYGKAVKYPFPMVRDIDGYVARHLGATMTPQVFVIDQSGTLRFRGAIDDNRYENRVRHHYLTDALDAVIGGTNVTVATANAMGCTVHLTTDVPAEQVTYSDHVARVLQDNCQSCHREGQVAPFSITSYSEAKTWRTEIESYTRSRLMPPWKASPGFAHYSNDVSLSDREIDLVSKWVSQGAPLGREEDVPPSPRFNDGWAFGSPDLIVEMPEEYVVGAEGDDDYRHFVIPYEADKHRFIRAIDVKPGNTNVVHHVIAYVDTTGKARKLDAADPGPGYTRFGGVGFDAASMLGGWAPGNLPLMTPAGTGRWLPDKCDIVLQVHYYRSGVEERDRTKVGIYFSDAPSPAPVRDAIVINNRFDIPAGDGNHVVRAQKRISEASWLFSVTPHMHLIGETMEVTAHCPDGKIIPISKIDDWDFNWQTTYQFDKVQYLPAGTVVKLVATFDNSEENPNNPNSPPKNIGWGEMTTDEMCIAFLAVLRASEFDPNEPSSVDTALRPAGIKR